MCCIQPIYRHAITTLKPIRIFHLCIANRDNLALVFGLLACYICALISLALEYDFYGAARVNQRTRIVTYAASCRDLPITQAEHSYDDNSSQIAQNCVIEYFCKYLSYIDAHATRPAPRLQIPPVCRAPWGEARSTEVPTDSYSATLLPNYLNDIN